MCLSSVSVAGYPPLQPASFKPQSTRRQGTVAVHYQFTTHASAGFALQLHQRKRKIGKAVNNL